MNERHLSELKKGLQLYEELRLQEAYPFFRRFYDRIPFRLEPEHAQNLAVFIRILFELRKSQELQFYANVLQSHYERTHDAESGFQLAYVYCHPGPNQRLKTAKKVLEEIAISELSTDLQIKAKLCLAYCYDVLFHDVASCRKLIDSLPATKDVRLTNLIQTWQANVLIDENKLTEAEAVLQKLIESVQEKTDWWSFYLARINLCRLYAKQSKGKEAEALLRELIQLTAGKPLRSVSEQLQLLMKELKQAKAARSSCHTQRSLQLESEESW